MKTFIALHLILSALVIGLLYYKNQNKVSYIAPTIIILVFPIGGSIIVYLLYLNNLEFSSIKAKYDYLDMFKDEIQNFRYVRALNILDETRVIPMSKALNESSIKRRREAVLNLIKKDVNNYTSIMNMALINDDSETSHYAASSILHSKRILDNNLNRIIHNYNKDNENPIIIFEYADQLMKYINNGYVDDSIKLQYIPETISILSKIVNNKLDLDKRHITNLINLLLKIENYKDAVKYSEVFLEEYPNCEDKFLLVLKVFYLMKDHDGFERVLKQFISTDITFSRETVNVVRFWLGG